MNASNTTVRSSSVNSTSPAYRTKHPSSIKFGNVDLAHAPGGMERCHAGAYEIGAAFTQLWLRKAAKPDSKDLISIMLRSDAMKEVSEAEFIGNMILLIVGGNDATCNSMSGFDYGLYRFPAERA